MLSNLQSGDRRRIRKAAYAGLALLVLLGLIGLGIGFSGSPGNVGLGPLPGPDLLPRKGRGDRPPDQPGPGRGRPHQGRRDRPLRVGRPRDGTHAPRPDRRELRRCGEHLHGQGPPSAHRRRHRLGQVHRHEPVPAGRAPRPLHDAGVPRPRAAQQGRQRLGRHRRTGADREHLHQSRVLAYQAGQVRKGDRASTKAQGHQDADEKQVLKKQLEQVKSQALVQQTEELAPTPTPTIG